MTERQGTVLNAIAFSPDGHHVATGMEDSSTVIWKFSRDWWDVE